MSIAGVKPWLILGLIFAAGLITGAALTVALRSEWMRPPGAVQMQRHWMQYLTTRLDLTPEQQTKIETILSAAGAKLKQVHEDEVGRISGIFRDTDAQITPLLTADQKANFAKMELERQHDFSHHMHHGWREDGPPPGGPGPEGKPPPPMEQVGPGKDD